MHELTSRTLPNGVVTTSQYDGLNRLTRLTHAKGANTLADFQYQFNTVNDITQMTDGAGAHNYTYDSVDRLAAATHPNQTNESYSYDEVGNRTASHQGSSYTYQAFNRLVAANGASFGYDASGDLTSKTDASGSWTYTWDYENRLKVASLSGGVTVNYSYDALGRLIQRTSSTGSTTKFVYDGADVIRDLDSNGGTIADYLNGPGIDNKLRMTSGGVTSYFATDHLGTTRALTDASGNLTSSLTYDSFGKLASGSPATRYTYSGREFDSEAGLMHYRARWYDPQQGRFISEDPIGFAGGDMGLYAYVANSPIRYNDPLGLQVRSDSRNQPGEVESARRLAKAVQPMGSCPEGNKIYVCCRVIDIPLVSILSRVTGVRHCYIQTPNRAAGMGPAGGGPLPLNPFGVETTINDHSKETGGDCIPACNVDQNCVERELEIGKSTGKWSLSNNCNTVAKEIIKKCKKACQ